MKKARDQLNYCVAQKEIIQAAKSFIFGAKEKMKQNKKERKEIEQESKN